MENRKNTGLRKRKLPNDGTVQEEPDIKKMCQALKEIESELQNLRDDNSQLQNLKVMYQALKEIESELQNLRDDNSQLRDELLEKDRELAETRTLLVDREHKLSNTQALLVDREQQLAAQTLVVDTESCAAYRPPLRVIHTPARVGAVTTPLRPTNIPAPGKPKPVLRSTTGATGAQLQRSKVPGSILLREENQSMQVCLIKQMEELKQKRDQETLMLNMLEEDREAMGEAAEAITSLVNQLDASCEEIEDEGIKGPKTEIDLKRSMRQLVLSFLKTASVEELQTFKGIGEKRARMILELRELSPEIFASVENVLYSIEMKKPQVSNMMWDMMVGP